MRGGRLTELYEKQTSSTNLANVHVSPFFHDFLRSIDGGKHGLRGGSYQHFFNALRILGGVEVVEV